MERLTPVVLTVGTTHPLNIAGLGLDLRVAARLGVQIVTVVAGVSAQDAHAVLDRRAVDASLIAAQFAALRDARAGAVHIGALVDAASVRAVATALPALGAVAVVCDPVIAASNGARLADEATVAALRSELFHRCTLVTPNIHEAAQLVGRSIRDLADMERAAVDLRARGVQAVLVKGGHLTDTATDVLVDANGVQHFEAPRIGATVRGTGDLLACAIAARLAFGDSVRASIESARGFVRECLAAGVPLAGTRTVP